MASDIEREAERVRRAYARRRELGLDARYAYWQPANLFIYQARERVLLRALDRAGLLPVTGLGVLDAGCGDGAVLQDFLRYGAREPDLCGIDLLPDRVAAARLRLPGATIDTGDAQSLPYADASFDIVLTFTLFSSVLKDEARRRIAAELRRVLRSGGLVVVYDFWTNPLNRDTKPLRRGQLARLFPGCSIDFERTTLAPPLTRLLTKAPGGRLACSVLEVIPFLQTHYVAAVHV